MKENIIKDIYENMQMGILGIEEVLYKAQDNKLAKELQTLKKSYEKNAQDSKKYLENLNEEIPRLNSMTKLSTEMMATLKLSKENNDKTIIAMMQKGLSKSLDILTSRKIDYDKMDIYALKIISNTYKTLIKSCKKMSKLDSTITG